MEYFKNGLKSVLGAPSLENSPSGAETVEKLINRVLSSVLLDDRRDACRALKALSRTYRIEVGAHGMSALKQVLDMDKTDFEIVSLVLDILVNLTSPETFEEEDHRKNSKHNIGEQFTEILIKTSDNVSQVLKFLEEYDFRVRLPALKLLANLLSNKSKEIQEIILERPMGVSKLMDMLSDSREVIRNDALLLLIQLTKGNSNIQKIVAFENAFDRIFDVILQEGGIDGGIVVEDCLLLMANLLKGNHSNQYFFKEGGYIKKLTPMFQLAIDTIHNNSLIGWSSQKVANVHCVIQVVRTLIAPDGTIQSVTSCQNFMKICGLLQALCDILIVTGVPADVLAETICAVAEVVRGNKNNQDYLENVMAPSSPPRPIIVVLLMSMINERQPFLLRCAVHYCFQCLLYKNDIKQMQLVETLLPQGNVNTSLTTGHLLCGALFSSDSLSNWFSAVALSYALMDDINQKEQLLRVLLATSIGDPPITLMHQCIFLLKKSNKIQSKLGLLILLCKWMSYSPLSVTTFLKIETSISYLMALLSSSETTDDLQETLLQSMCALLIAICIHFNDDSVSNYKKIQLLNLVEKRIGLEIFQHKIGDITKHEIYSRSLKHPQISAMTPYEVSLDYEFCLLIKVLEGVVLKSILNYGDARSKMSDEVNNLRPTESSIIEQYKDIIREQDFEIQRLNKLVYILSRDKEVIANEIMILKDEVNTLTDQMRLTKLSNGSYFETENPSSDFRNLEPNIIELNKCKEQVKDMKHRLSQSLMTIKELQSKTLENEENWSIEQKLQDLEEYKKNQEDLLELVAYQDKEINMYKEKLLALNQKFDPDNSFNQHYALEKSE